MPLSPPVPGFDTKVVATIDLDVKITPANDGLGFDEAKARWLSVDAGNRVLEEHRDPDGCGTDSCLAAYFVVAKMRNVQIGVRPSSEKRPTPEALDALAELLRSRGEQVVGIDEKRGWVVIVRPEELANVD